MILTRQYYKYCFYSANIMQHNILRNASIHNCCWSRKYHDHHYYYILS